MNVGNIPLFLRRRSVVELILLTELFAFLIFIFFVFVTDGTPPPPEFAYGFYLAFLLFVFGSPFVWIAYGVLRRKVGIPVAVSSAPVNAAGRNGGSSALQG